MSQKLRWGWDRHGTNIQPTTHKETRKEEEERGCGCGCGWGRGVGERLHQDPTGLDCQLVERWRRGESESPMSLSSPSQLGGQLYSLLWPLRGRSQACCMEDRGQTATPATEIVALPLWEMLLRSAESDVVDGTGCGVGKRWHRYTARRVGRAMGTTTHPWKALDSPPA